MGFRGSGGVRGMGFRKSFKDLEEGVKKKEPVSIAILTIICVLIFTLLVSFYVFHVHKSNVMKSSREASFNLAGVSVSKAISSPILSNAPINFSVDNWKDVLKAVSIIAVYIVVIFYSVKELNVAELLILLPLLFILTIPPMFQYIFKGLPIFSVMPIEEPFVLFLLTIVIANLWYMFSYEVDVNMKTLSTNMSIILVLLYITFKYYYRQSRSESLIKSIGLTGASGIFMMSAPIYAYIPK